MSNNTENTQETGLIVPSIGQIESLGENLAGLINAVKDQISAAQAAAESLPDSKERHHIETGIRRGQEYLHMLETDLEGMYIIMYGVAASTSKVIEQLDQVTTERDEAVEHAEHLEEVIAEQADDIATLQADVEESYQSALERVTEDIWQEGYIHPDELIDVIAQEEEDFLEQALDMAGRLRSIGKEFEGDEVERLAKQGQEVRKSATDMFYRGQKLYWEHQEALREAQQKAQNGGQS
jgi:hypothetical protein